MRKTLVKLLGHVFARVRDSRERRRITRGGRSTRARPSRAFGAGDSKFESQARRRELDLFGLGSGIRKTEFSPDGSLLAVVGSNSNVALYDVATATRRLVPRRVPKS